MGDGSRKWGLRGGERGELWTQKPGKRRGGSEESAEKKGKKFWDGGLATPLLQISSSYTQNRTPSLTEQSGFSTSVAVTKKTYIPL